MKKKITFEEAYSALKSTSEQIEKGEIPLDHAITLFEEGVLQYKRCMEILDGAEQKIKIINAQLEAQQSNNKEVADEL